MRYLQNSRACYKDMIVDINRHAARKARLQAVAALRRDHANGTTIKRAIDAFAEQVLASTWRLCDELMVKYADGGLTSPPLPDSTIASHDLGYSAEWLHAAGFTKGAPVRMGLPAVEHNPTPPTETATAAPTAAAATAATPAAACRHRRRRRRRHHNRRCHQHRRHHQRRRRRLPVSLYAATRNYDRHRSRGRCRHPAPLQPLAMVSGSLALVAMAAPWLRSVPCCSRGARAHLRSGRETARASPLRLPPSLAPRGLRARGLTSAPTWRCDQARSHQIAPHLGGGGAPIAVC